MTPELQALIFTAATIGFIHTLFGPDHYLPFIMMSMSRRWTLLKTILVTVLCGLGHVLSSVVLGTAGIGLGIAVGRLEQVEGRRGDWAAWALVAFGLVYLVWGLRRAMRRRSHTHIHAHPDIRADSQSHSHTHTHEKEHTHVHDETAKANITPWALFVIFVLGPCEPLIPILMYPAAQESHIGLLVVTLVFCLVTVGTMVSVVVLGSYGVNFLPLGRIERYSHALAGGAILLCGVAIHLGL